MNSRLIPVSLLAALLASGSALALPSSAGASETIGSSLQTPENSWECDGGDATSDPEDFPCVLIQDTIDGEPVQGPPDGGIVTQWSVRGASGTIAFRVLDFEGPYEAGKLKAAARNESPDETATGGLDSFDTRQRIEPGDYIGIVLQDSDAAVGYRDGSEYSEATTLFEGPGELNDNSFVSDLDSPGELLFQAVVESDDDSDGCGDETQEHLCEDDGGGGDDGGGDDGSGDYVPEPDPPAADPLAALKAGGTPRTRLGAKKLKASKTGVVRITVRNPDGYRVKGKLVLRGRGGKLGAKAFAVGANSSRAVRVKLSRRAFRSLKRKRRMSATVTATARGPIGKARVFKSKVSIKAPKVKKKRRRSGGGGGGGGLYPRPFCVPHIEYDANGYAYAIPC